MRNDFPGRHLHQPSALLGGRFRQNRLTIMALHPRTTIAHCMPLLSSTGASRSGPGSCDAEARWKHRGASEVATEARSCSPDFVRLTRGGSLLCSRAPLTECSLTQRYLGYARAGDELN